MCTPAREGAIDVDAPPLAAGESMALYHDRLAARRRRGGTAGTVPNPSPLQMSTKPSRLFDKALAAFRSGDAVTADRLLRDILAIAPDHFDSLRLLGYLHGLAGRPDQAAHALQRAVRIQPTDVNVRINLGKALGDAGRVPEAIEQFRQATLLQPDSFSAWFGLAALSAGLGRNAEAVELYGRALAIDPRAAPAWANRGNARAALKRHADALADLDRAIGLDPGLATAWSDKAATLMELGRHDEALEHYTRALAIDPTLPFIAGQALHLRMLCCDWHDLQPRIDALRADLAQGRLVADPFGFQAVSTSEAELRTCAERYAAATFPQMAALAPQAVPAPPPGRRIRIGYLCGEFRAQATSVLMAGLFERHDRERFELFAFDSGWDDGSVLRQRIERAFEHLVPIAHLDDDAAAEAVRSAGVDILVNLNGYFGQVRQGVFARRAAPIQVNYLGFPGTLGAPYIDYLIADPIVIPQHSRQHYTEKIAWLAGCYQPNDPGRTISDAERPRSELGLPERGFVFCCFNNNYKITPAMFDRWMRILRAVEGSVLWLLQDNRWAERNLRAEAARHDVDPARLVFADREPLPDHLARHRQADLFLDTAPYNAHTTASDALWAGVPLLTMAGSTFPGRVAASLLQAVGLPELVAPDGEAYEQSAISLARDPARLASLRDRLACGRDGSSLFDATGQARRIEALYEAMYRRHVAGLPPEHLPAQEGP